MTEPVNEKSDRFKIECPKCKHIFFGSWDTNERVIVVSSCQSTGVYSVHIECPKCEFVEDLQE